jgi:alanine dehydrogenase
VPAREGDRSWLGGDSPEFWQLAAGDVPGRTGDEQITHYHNIGNQGLQFSSLGGLVYRKARAAGAGREIPTEWFLQDIRDRPGSRPPPGRGS